MTKKAKPKGTAAGGTPGKQSTSTAAVHQGSSTQPPAPGPEASTAVPPTDAARSDHTQPAKLHAEHPTSPQPTSAGKEADQVPPAPGRPPNTTDQPAADSSTDTRKGEKNTFTAVTGAQATITKQPSPSAAPASAADAKTSAQNGPAASAVTSAQVPTGTQVKLPVTTAPMVTAEATTQVQVKAESNNVIVPPVQPTANTHKIATKAPHVSKISEKTPQTTNSKLSSDPALPTTDAEQPAVAQMMPQTEISPLVTVSPEPHHSTPLPPKPTTEPQTTHLSSAQTAAVLKLESQGGSFHTVASSEPPYPPCFSQSKPRAESPSVPLVDSQPRKAAEAKPSGLPSPSTISTAEQFTNKQKSPQNLSPVGVISSTQQSTPGEPNSVGVSSTGSFISTIPQEKPSGFDIIASKLPEAVIRPIGAPEQLLPLAPVNSSDNDKVLENDTPKIVSDVIKEVLSDQPTKKPTVKQNKREKSTKQQDATASEVPSKTNPEIKHAISEASKGKSTLPKVATSQLKENKKDEPIKKGATKHSGSSDPPSSSAVADSLGQSDCNVASTEPEKPPAAKVPQDTKSSTATAAKLSTKEGSNKKDTSKKNKQKTEANASKSEPPSSSKKLRTPEPLPKNEDACNTENCNQSVLGTKDANIDDADKASSKQITAKAVAPQTLESILPDSLPESSKEENKSSPQTKNAQESKDVNIPSEKEDKTSKKKNKIQPIGSSEGVKAREKKDSKTSQDTEKRKIIENNKKSSSLPHRGVTDLENVTGETRAKTDLSKPQSPTIGHKAPNAEGNIEEISNEQEIGSKKKKRNRHKKKNKTSKDDKDIVNEATDESKAIEKSASSQEEGRQKDTQKSQLNKTKGKQPGSSVNQEENSVMKERASENEPQTPASKKRNRHKKKTAGKDGEQKDAEENKPEIIDNKLNKPVEASVQKPLPRAEGTPKKKNEPKFKSKSGHTNKESDTQVSVTDTSVAESEDQQEKFVEVKSKNKRNKKNKLNDTHADLACTSSTNDVVSNSDNQNSVTESMVSYKEEKEATVDNKAKLSTNKVAAPKLSPEAREQKLLKKKLAERAQQKIQQQIESNCLSEAEKSEKYLETITKNLKELTKLRSSRLEDILQKSAADGEEEFDYEYSPIQRTTFLATTCHICKESKPKENLRICNLCQMISYCSEEHQKSDWPAHKDLCQAVAEICKERGTSSLFAPAAGLSPEDYRSYRMNALLECSSILNRPLQPFEQEMILYPNVCHTCHLPAPSQLQTCEKCEMTSYCSLEHRQSNHDMWCPDLQLFKDLITYQSRNGFINPQLPAYYPESAQLPGSDMHSFLQAVLAGRDCTLLERAAISEIATGPLTTVFALHKANKINESTEKLVVHFVGAEWSFELERSDKWETFLLHLVPSLKLLILVFIGPEVAGLPGQARRLLEEQSRSCSRCHGSGRRVELAVAPQLFYHEYVASASYITPDVICAFNAGLYRMTGYQAVDSWSETLPELLRDPRVPLVVTSYTAEEALRDVERLRRCGPLAELLAPSQNPYRSLRPSRNFASDDVTPVIFKNFYVTIVAPAVS